MNNFEEKWKIQNKSDEDLKGLAKDLYNGILYTDRHCGIDVASVFMCLMFMGPKPPKKPEYESSDATLDGKRDNVIYDLIQRDLDEDKYQLDMISYKEELKYYHDIYVPSIGLIYEYIKEAGPMCVNGKPIFSSMRMLNKQDTEKLFEYYEKYKEIREIADNF